MSVIHRRTGAFLSLIVACGLCVVPLSTPAAGPSAFWTGLSTEERERILGTLAREMEAVRQGVVERAAAEEQAAKTLSQLLDELDTPGTGDALRDYTAKYAIEAYRALVHNPARFAEIAGAVSAGDYTELKQEIPRVTATAFASLVGDALEVYGYTHTQAVWQELVRNADALQEIGVAFMRGETDKAFNLAKEQARGRLEDFSREIVAQVINWVFEPTGVRPGGLYVQMIQAQIVSIQWAENVFARSFLRECLDIYVSEYDRTRGSKELAREEYELCALRGAYWAAERTFDREIRQAGLDPEKVRRQILETYRIHGHMPDAWLTERILAEEHRIKVELASAQANMDRVWSHVFQAFGRRLEQMAIAVKGEEELAALELAAREALRANAALVDRTRLLAESINASCIEFDDARSEASVLWAEAASLSGKEIRVRRLARAIPECTQDPESTLVVEARRLQSVFDQGLAQAQAGLDVTCGAREGLADAMNQEQARAWVQQARDGAAQSASGVEAARAAYAAFTPVLYSYRAARESSVGKSNLGQVRLGFAQMMAELEEIRASVPGMRAAFENKLSVMAFSRNRARTRRDLLSDHFNDVELALTPHRSGPLGAEVRTILEEIRSAMELAYSCEAVISQQWSTWQFRNLNNLPDLSSLDALVADARARCPIAESLADGGPAPPPEEEIANLFSALDAAMPVLDIAQRGYEHCLAQVLVSYQSAWLDRQTNGADDPVPQEPSIRSVDSTIASVLVARTACDLQQMERQAASAKSLLGQLGDPSRPGIQRRETKISRILGSYPDICSPAGQPDRAYVVVRISGSGYVPHWAGGSYEFTGYEDHLIILERGQSLAEVIDRSMRVGNRCHVHDPPTVGGFRNRRPWFWKKEPSMNIQLGPTTDRNAVVPQELLRVASQVIRNWDRKDSDGPSMSELKRLYCGD